MQERSEGVLEVQQELVENCRAVCWVSTVSKPKPLGILIREPEGEDDEARLTAGESGRKHQEDTA